MYGDAATFLRNTHPAGQLCKVIQAIFDRLSDPKEPGATIRLSTGYEGGKTHTLRALWHPTRNISDPSWVLSFCRPPASFIARPPGSSLMDNNNVPLGAIRRLLGHENRTTTEIYLHPLGNPEREAMTIYEEAIRRRQDSEGRVDMGKSPT